MRGWPVDSAHCRRWLPQAQKRIRRNVGHQGSSLKGGDLAVAGSPRRALLGSCEVFTQQVRTPTVPPWDA